MGETLNHPGTCYLAIFRVDFIHGNCNKVLMVGPRPAVYIGLSSFPVLVTTRICYIFVIGDSPTTLSVATSTGNGGQPKIIYGCFQK